jgi:phosphoglycolate phosphatase-like HAD superfamily hydrolase
MIPLRIGSLDFSPALVIFDKDGTLIDFNFMWASWVIELARRLEHAMNIPIASDLYSAMGYDAARHTVIAGSPLAAHSMADLYALTERVVKARGVSRTEAERATNAAWFVPDPIAMARPLADLPRVFSTLRARGILTAVATSDDRASTNETLRALGLFEMVNALVSADDGLPNKPAPDMLLRVCEELNVAPASALMIGDSVADMQAARAAGIGLRVAVLSGVTARAEIEAHADIVLENVDGLLQARAENSFVQS